MTLNILFFTVTFKKRSISPKEALHHEYVERLYEQQKDRLISNHYLMH